MTHQSEQSLENALIQQLVGMRYQRVQIADEDDVLDNLQDQLEAFNSTTFSEREFKNILNHLAKGTVFDKAKTLRDRFQLKRDNDDVFYVRFFDSDDVSGNLFQVTNQITQEGHFQNRYDVTILINGLPLMQIELKRRGLELKEAFNQILRYKQHSFWTNNGLFQYVQLFVISNGVNSKYYVNNPIKTLSFKQTFFWADVKNNNICDLSKFTTAFLSTAHLSKMIAQYVVINETHKMLMVLRPYQFFATEAIITHVHNTTENGYIWHTTGSGKTLTSFKAAQILMELPEIHKVVFVVDRKDLDYQTMQEFNSFKKGSVDSTTQTKSLVDQFLGRYTNKQGQHKSSNLIVTTIQKLNNAIEKAQHRAEMQSLADKRIVFIFDECHRSQFGDTHKRITEFFSNAQLFGFTGTPIFADNAQKNQLGKRTTKDLFHECLHKYVITDAIRDNNVLRFGIEYLGRYKQVGNTVIDIEVEDIDTKEVIESPIRLGKIVDHIIHYHDAKTQNKAFSAIFAVSSIPVLIEYYKIFQQKKDAGEHDLRIATIFTYGANEDNDDAQGLLPDEHIPDMSFGQRAAETAINYDSAESSHYVNSHSVNSHSRDQLEACISDYNSMYGTSFSTKDGRSFENYAHDISKKLKEREKENALDSERIDILLVVNMFLTGFDAKKVNTLYVDKNLKQHGLIQAFSRTNRILDERKSQGNILCFRNLKKATDEAIALFSNLEAKEEILVAPYEDVVGAFHSAFEKLLVIAPSIESVNDLRDEDAELAFIQAFRTLMRIKNVLTSFADFDWNSLPLSEQMFDDYKSKYLDLYDKVKSDHEKEKVSILQDVDFELELIHRDDVNVAYILKLIKQLKLEDDEKKASDHTSIIMNLLAGDVELRSKRELIEEFIQNHLPAIDDVDAIQDEFERFWNDKKILTLKTICDEENLDQAQFQALINEYLYSERDPLDSDVLKCLDSRPSILQAHAISQRILIKMKDFVEIFMQDMVI